jgi:peptidylprolyl isomerase
MARKRDRVFALVIAMAFLFTTVGVSVALIVQLVQENKAADTEQTDVSTEDTAQPQAKPTTLKGTEMDGFTPVAKVEKLQTTDLVTGTGAQVKAGDTVTVDYVGVVAADGKVFDSSFNRRQQATFSLSQVIPGWSEGMVGMKEGGKRRMFIPADKGYGANPPQGSDIPANADLVFDVTLHKIGQ